MRAQIAQAPNSVQNLPKELEDMAAIRYDKGKIEMQASDSLCGRSSTPGNAQLSARLTQARTLQTTRHPEIAPRSARQHYENMKRMMGIEGGA